MAEILTLYEEGQSVSRGIALVYDAAAQTTYHALYGLAFDLPAVETVLHLPDRGAPVPTAAFDVNRRLYLELNVDPGTDNDDVLNAIARLRRWIDGEDQQAARYAVRKDVYRIMVRQQRDGATNYTDHPLISGLVDDGAAMYQAAAVLGKKALRAVIVLQLEPHSNGAAMTLHNDISNPAMLMGTAGSASDWGEFSAPATTRTLDTTAYLIGGQSQKIVTDSSTDQGIFSNTITVAAATDLNAYLWIYHAGGDTVTILIRDGSGVTIDSATVTAANPGANADRSHTDPAGNVWYRIPLSGNNTNANARLLARRITATQVTTFYVDGAYLDAASDSLTIPAGWMSSSAIENESAGDFDTDPTSINYYDVWGIPGDAPALVRHKITPTVAATKYYLIAGRGRDGREPVAQQTNWIESEDFGANYTSPVNGAWTTGTGTSSNHFYRFTESGVGTGSGNRYAGFTGEAARALLRNNRRIMLAARASSTAARFTVYTVSPDNVQQAATLGVKTANTWELIDIGALLGEQVLPDTAESPDPVNYPIMFFVVEVSAVPTSGTADFSSVWLPMSEEYLIADATIPTGAELWLDGIQQAVIAVQTGQYEPGAIGSLWHATPGPVANRYSLGAIGALNQYAYDDSFSVTLEVIPRTRHLLGTE